MKITSITIQYEKKMGDSVYTPKTKFLEYIDKDKSWRSDAQIWNRDLKLMNLLMEYMKEFD